MSPIETYVGPEAQRLLDVANFYAEKTVLPWERAVPWLYDAAATFGDLAGLDELTSRTVLTTMLGGIVVGWFLSILPRGKIQHLTNILLGVFTLQFILSGMWVHAMFSSLVVYILLLTVGHTRWGPWIVTMFAVAYVIVCHLYRMFVDYASWTMDFTGPQMVLTMKFTSIAFNLYDGTVRSAELTKVVRDPAAKSDIKAQRKQKLAQEQLNFAVQSAPSLLEYFGWVFLPITLFAGPSFEFQDYRRSTEEGAPGIVSGGRRAWNERRIRETRERFGDPAADKLAAAQKTENIVASETADTFFSSPVVTRYVAVGQRVLAALLVLGLFSSQSLFLGSKRYEDSFEEVEPEAPIVSHVLLFIRRIGFILVWMFLTRCKYYGGWYFSEAGLIMAGFGYSGGVDTPKTQSELMGDWNGVQNIDVFGLELSQSIPAVTRAWNQRTQLWLQRYTYVRVTAAGGANIWATYIMSAVWHGFYPGYFVLFLAAGLCTVATRQIRSRFRPWMFYDVEQKHPIPHLKAGYDVFTLLCTTVLLNTLTACFTVLTGDRVLAVLKSVYFFPFAAVIATMVLIQLVPNRSKLAAADTAKKTQ